MQLIKKINQRIEKIDQRIEDYQQILMHRDLKEQSDVFLFVHSKVKYYQEIRSEYQQCVNALIYLDRVLEQDEIEKLLHV